MSVHGLHSDQRRTKSWAVRSRRRRPPPLRRRLQLRCNSRRSPAARRRPSRCPVALAEARCSPLRVRRQACSLDWTRRPRRPPPRQVRRTLATPRKSKEDNPPSACPPPSGGNGVHQAAFGLDRAHQRGGLAFTGRQIEECRKDLRRLQPPLLLEFQPPPPAQLGADGVHDLHRRRRRGQPQAHHLRNSSASSAQKAAQSTARMALSILSSVENWMSVMTRTVSRESGTRAPFLPGAVSVLCVGR